MHIGIDLGSRTIKIAALENGQLVDQQITESGFDPHSQSLAMISRYRPARVVATGYGRHLAQRHFADDVITEIKAHALGARHHFPECTTVVDIGGQDSKVISLGANGSVINFQMNDKCAAGTGKFLEIMASSLGYRLDEFGSVAMGSAQEVTINSMCTVFAESEVISMKNHGSAPADIARGVHLSVVNRIVTMLCRIGYGESIVFSGGVARNPCIVAMLQEQLQDTRVESPPAPDIVGALGAALHAARQDAS